jgi:hypothetical protein
VNKEEVYTPFLREHWEFGDEEDEEDEEEKYAASRGGRSKGPKRGSRSDYRALRHLQLTCPLCKSTVADSVSARIAHWRQAHSGQDLIISQATWVLRQSEAELKASKLKPDYQTSRRESDQNGTRYWKLATLEAYAARETIFS